MMATNPPTIKVQTRASFCLNSMRSLVRIGRGRQSMARSVRMLMGAEARYMETTSMQTPFAFSVNAADTGRH
jgi:hypothetical protein